MTTSAQQFPYVARDPALGNASLASMRPLTLSAGQSAAASGLVDSGAAINVLLYALGLELAFDWSQQAGGATALR